MEEIKAWKINGFAGVLAVLALVAAAVFPAEPGFGPHLLWRL
jgi:hypothetical protein